MANSIASPIRGLVRIAVGTGPVAGSTLLVAGTTVPVEHPRAPVALPIEDHPESVIDAPQTVVQSVDDLIAEIAGGPVQEAPSEGTRKRPPRYVQRDGVVYEQVPGGLLKLCPNVQPDETIPPLDELVEEIAAAEAAQETLSPEAQAQLEQGMADVQAGEVVPLDSTQLAAEEQPAEQPAEQAAAQPGEQPAEQPVVEAQPTSAELLAALPAHAEGADLNGIIVSLEPTGVQFTDIETAMKAVFGKYNAERLGGASGDRGWSSFSTYQRCPYLYKRHYLDGKRFEGVAPAALEVGSVVHALLAVKYQCMIEKDYPVTPEVLFDGLMEAGCNAENVLKGKQMYDGYESWYADDYLVPLAVEAHAMDPYSRESCRYDLIARVDSPPDGLTKGTYIIEHKTAARIDDNVDAWRNDGEILGQLMLYKRLKLDKKYGKLRGTIVNIIGKMKVFRCFRYTVPIQQWIVKHHADDLKVWGAMIEMSRATGNWTRARANCVNKFGRCNQFQHCADRVD